MLPKTLNQDSELLDVSKDVPFISLIMPFESKMSKNTDLVFKLNTAADKIEKELLEKYPKSQATPVVTKLRRVIKDMDYNIRKQSIAIFVSPLIEKVYYFKYSASDN